MKTPQLQGCRSWMSTPKFDCPRHMSYLIKGLEESIRVPDLPSALHPGGTAGYESWIRQPNRGESCKCGPTLAPERRTPTGYGDVGLRPVSQARIL